MARMSRGRTGMGETVTALMAEYHRQCAFAVFLIGKSARIRQQGQGYAWVPGLHSVAQVAGERI
jgi:N-ethylmaleimide reductase